MSIDQSADDSHIKNFNNNDYNFFPFAIIWGKYEKLEGTGIFVSLDIENPPPYNQTMHVIAYVDYEHRFIYRTASSVHAPLWFGFIGKHRLFIIALGDSVVVGP
jgi:hypothetical protein